MGIKNGMRAVHPGEILREDYLVPLEMSANALSKALRVPAPRINDIVRERRGITADTAMRLARYFGGDARSWLNLQTSYELRKAEIENAERIENEIQPAAQA
ncbi:addiction module antidote protein, HigA family [Wenzhouxiangella sp. 15181]|nr:addiction module antidote protein, HigA family [Wenzhouxiangella sp. 15181]RFP69327.1 addiction module antidote protein, HigA family [Wenzhouxiangella sp. 15190]